MNTQQPFSLVAQFNTWSTEKYKYMNATSQRQRNSLTFFHYIRSEKKFAFKGKKCTLMSCEYME